MIGQSNIHTFGPWEIQCDPRDGARISMLRFKDIDIFTREPERFASPKQDYGLYETRPVYGYDDCFPGIAPSLFPVRIPVRIPDHGEVCWMPWSVVADESSLECVVDCDLVPMRFRRRLVFDNDSLRWDFEVHNNSEYNLPFLHAMHGCMPVEDIRSIKLPAFGNVFDEIAEEPILATHAALSPSESLASDLLNTPKGETRMLLLRNVEEGTFEVQMHSGLKIDVRFSQVLFPTLGIWWNNGAYPDEPGLQRQECIFEPICGLRSSLEKAFREGCVLTVLANRSLRWSVTWNVKKMARKKSRGSELAVTRTL